MSKVSERFVAKWLWEIIKDKIDPRQFGSVKSSSTVHALVELLHRSFHNTDGAKQYSRFLLLDYSKAFALIDHNILMKKLQILDVPPFLLRWIAAFLTDHKQQVRIKSYMSSWEHVHGGVPQGTKLGPPLFVVMINDLRPYCDTIQFVDNSTIEHSCPDLTCQVIQFSVDEAVARSQENGMCVNPTKPKDLGQIFPLKLSVKKALNSSIST
jgi:hypothetical protein